MNDKKLSEQLAELFAAATDESSLKKAAITAIDFVKQQEAEIAGHKATIDEANDQNETLLNKILDLKNEISDHLETIDEATNENLALQNKIEILKKGGSVKQEVTVGEDVYTVEHAVNHNAKIYKPEQIAENADLVKILIAGNSTALALKVTD